MRKQSVFIKPAAVLLAVSILFAGCASSTMIQSVPTGAKVYLNGELAGKTPYLHSDTKIVGTVNDLKLELDGYKPLYTSFSRNEEVDAGAIVGGVLVLIPFLWTMKYKPTHSYELIPLDGIAPDANASQDQLQTAPRKVNDKSAADRLRKLKELLDEKVISQEDYEKEKQKILNEI